MKSIIVMIMALSGVFASASRVEALEKELSPDETIEIDEISDICDALKKAYESKKAMDHEKKISKVSGAVSLSRINQAGRDGVEATEEADRLLALYKKKYNEFPDLDNRCKFFVDMNQSEKKSLYKEGKKVRKNPTGKKSGTD